jgi:lysophospholipase L1-like esterase
MRVVCFGGSTTFGWGVPDGAEYPRQLETRLNALDPEHRRWQVINAGVTNYSTHQGLALVRRVLGPWRADIVLFNFSWGDHQPARNGVPDNNIRMPSGWRLGLENALMQSVAVQYARDFLTSDGASSANTAPSAHTTWRVDPTIYVANEEKLILFAAELGARPIWVTSPIAWPPPGQSDTSGIFHYHHRYHRAGRYGATLGGGEIAELANNFNLYRDFFDDSSVDFEHFNATGHNFAGDYLARFILGLPLESPAPTRLSPDGSTDQ